MMLTLQEQDTLTRLLETGVVRASERLGKMSHTEWGIMTSTIKEIPPVRLLSWFNRNATPHVGARFRSGVDVPLEVLTLFPETSARSVADAVTRPFAARAAKLANLVELTIGEVSNVIAQSLIGCLADEFNALIILSVPQVRTAPKVQLLSEVLEDYDGRKDVLLMSHIEMFSENLSAECSMVAVTNVGTLRRIFEHK